MGRPNIAVSDSTTPSGYEARESRWESDARVFEQQQNEKQQLRQLMREELYRYELSSGIPHKEYTDEEIDKIILQRQHIAETTPVITQTDPAQNLSPEIRQSLGYYTNDEREQAARMNDMRSAFPVNISPNFGRNFAYMYPGAELEAFRNTARYMPNYLLMPFTLGTPSYGQAIKNGLMSGMQMAKANGANFASRVGTAVTNAAGAVTPALTDPRALATYGTIGLGVADAAAATAKAGEDGGSFPWFSIGLMTSPIWAPLAMKGVRKVGDWVKSGNSGNVESQYTYMPNYSFYAWERPGSWVKRTNQTLDDNRWRQAIKEWNNIVGDPAKEKEFIEKYGLMWREPHKVTRTTGRGREYTETTSDYDTYTMSSNDVSKFLSSKGKITPVQYNDPEQYVQIYPKFLNTDAYALIGPTKSQIGWGYARDAGRVGLWSLPIFGAYGLFANHNNNNSKENTKENTEESTKTNTPETNTSTSSTQTNQQPATTQQADTVRVLKQVPDTVTTAQKKSNWF